ncbi:MAG: type III pantothenate kinase [Clostridia bacterium]|nr:type III pantothenate kinase [Clostridia bacterium]
MLLAIDIGNTNIKIGVFEGDKLVHSFRLSTVRMRTGDEYGLDILAQLNAKSISIKDIDGAIMSSVKPGLNYTFEHACDYYVGVKPLIVGSGIKTGLNVKYDNPRELGTDRIVNSVASYYTYGGPCITVDCGTATTFNVISEKGEFLGGAIAHGLKSSAEALADTAEKLPKIELVLPKKTIARTTITNMQVGLIQGYIGMAERIIRLMKEESGYANAKVIATGGLSEIIKNNSDVIDILDRTLTLRGLNVIYKLNTKG